MYFVSLHSAMTLLGGRVPLTNNLIVRAASTVTSIFFLTYYTQAKVLAQVNVATPQ
jgi:hypothetical protein